MRECATRLRENTRQLREDRGMRDNARQAWIVEGRGGPSERPVLTISGSGEGGRKRGGTPEPNRRIQAFQRTSDRDKGEVSNISSKVCSYQYRRYIY